MAAIALIKFTQGPNTDVAGRAVIGTLFSVDGSVTITNDNNTDVDSWQIILVDAPRDSSTYPPGSLPIQLGSGTGGSPPTSDFDPDVPGTYRALLDVLDSSGNRNRDIRCFGVPDGRGIIYPPYQGTPKPLPKNLPGIIAPISSPSSKPDEQNYSGQERGWAGESNSDGQLDSFFQIYKDNLTRVVTTTPFNVPIDESDTVAVFTTTIGGASIINLSASTRLGQNYEIVDAEGSANVNQITINLPAGDTFPDASSSVIIDLDLGVARVQKIGATSWVLLSGTTEGVTGPVSSTNNTIARWNGASGNAIKDSNVVIDDVSLSFQETVLNPEIRQNTDATGSATGDTFTIHAQDTTGITSTGGDLVFRPGSGTAAHGTIRLQSGDGIDRLTIESNGSIIFDSGSDLNLSSDSNTSFGMLDDHSSGSGSDLTIFGQDAAVTSGGDGGDIILRTGVGDGAGSDGRMEVLVDGTVTASFGNDEIRLSEPIRWTAETVDPLLSQLDQTAPNTSGVDLIIRSQSSTGTGTKAGGNVIVRGGLSSGGSDETGGSVVVEGGNAVGPTAQGGDVILRPGDASTGPATDGVVRVQTADSVDLIIGRPAEIEVSTTIAIDTASGNPANTGSIRLPNNQSINARNQADSADIPVIATDTSNSINIGGTNGNVVNIRAASATTQVQVGATFVAIGNNNLRVGTNTGNASSSSGINIRNAAASLWARNAANSGDVRLVNLDASDNLLLGDSSVNLTNVTSPLAINSAVGTVATAGHIRAASGFTAYARNVGDTANIRLLFVDGSNNLNIGDATNLASIFNDASSSISYRIAAALKLRVNSNGAEILNGSLSIDPAAAGPLATTGSIRGVNGFNVNARNAGNTADIELFKLDGSNNILIGGGTTRPSAVVIDAAGNGFLRVGGTDSLQWTASSLEFRRNVVQFQSTLSNPTILQGDDSTASAVGDTLLIRAQDCTGTTSTGGALNLRPGSGTSTDGVLNIQDGAGVNRIQVSSTGEITLGTNSATFFRTGGVGGTYRFAVTTAELDVVLPLISFRETIANPIIRQDTDATPSAAGDTFTIHAQDTSGATSTGGNLDLRAGSGTSLNGDVNIGTTNTNVVNVGTPLEVNTAAGTVAASGDIRGRNGFNIRARTTGGAAALLMSLSGSNTQTVGDGVNIPVTVVDATTTVRLRNAGSDILTVSAALVDSGTPLAVNSDAGTVATTGDIRTRNGFSFYSKTVGGADSRILDFSDSNTLVLGSNDTAFTYIRTNGTIIFQADGNTTRAFIDNDEFRLSVPNLRWTSGETAAIISHIATTEVSAANMTMTAQSSSHATGTGGSLIFNAGAGISADGDVNIGTANTNIVNVGTPLEVNTGAGTVAASGAIRGPANTVLLAARKGDNLSNLVAVEYSSDTLILGGLSAAASVQIRGAATVRSLIGGNTRFEVADTFVAVRPNILQIGVNDGVLATSGSIRGINGFSVYARNVGDTGNVHLMGLDGSDNLAIGQSSGGNANLYLRSAGNVFFDIAGLTRAHMDNDELRLYVTNFRWTKSAVGPTISHNAEDTTANAQNMAIIAQSNINGTSGDGGSLIFRPGSSTAGTNGSLRLQSADATDRFLIQANGNLRATTPVAGSFDVFVSGTQYWQFFGAGPDFRLLNGANIEWHQGSATPTISQANITTGNGQSMTIAAQSSTAVAGTITAGDLLLNAGDARSGDGTGGNDFTGGSIIGTAGEGDSGGLLAGTPGNIQWITGIGNGGDPSQMGVFIVETGNLGERMRMTQTQMLLTSANLNFAQTASISLPTDNVDDATGDTLTIKAQDVTGGGTTIKGGKLSLGGGNAQSGSATNKLDGVVELVTQLFFNNGNSYNDETISGSKTINLQDPHFHKIDGGAADRDILLPPEGDARGGWFWFRNSGTTNNLRIMEDTGGTPIVELAQGEQAIVICNGTTWITMGEFI